MMISLQRYISEWLFICLLYDLTNGKFQSDVDSFGQNDCHVNVMRLVVYVNVLHFQLSILQ